MIPSTPFRKLLAKAVAGPGLLAGVVAASTLTAGCKQSPSESREPTTATSQAPASGQAPSGVTANANDTARAAATPVAAELSPQDVYRINCQNCHGPDGKGSARAASMEKALEGISRKAWKARLEALDKPAGDEQVAAMTSGAEAALRERLTKGGERMPALALTPAEADAVIAYLRQLAGDGPADAKLVARLDAATLGERVYASNCASCHTKGRARAMGLMCQPASLAGATTRFSNAQVMQLLKVGVGPMPAFTQLNDNERAALWAHLSTLKPAPGEQVAANKSTCPMVLAAMQGRRTGHMMGGGMMGGMRGRMHGSMGQEPRGGMRGNAGAGSGHMMGPGMRGGAGGADPGPGRQCPMMMSTAPGAGGASASDSAEPLPPCCR